MIFVLVPIIELAVIIEVGERVGVLSTLVLLVAVSILGAILAKREGLGVWHRLKRTVEEGRMPSDELADGFMVLFGAALLLTPGFLTDGLGFLLLIPLTRGPLKQMLKRAMGAYVARRVEIGVEQMGARGTPRARRVDVVRVDSAESGGSPRDHEIGEGEDDSSVPEDGN